MTKIFNLLKYFAEKYIVYSGKLESLLLLVIRLWIADIFWKSGYLKISDFDSALQLFTDEHPVPFLSPYFAAVSAIIFELGCSALLILGLATRFAALPLIIMTAVIQFTYLQHTDHFYWAVLLFVLVIRGAGVFSADFVLGKLFKIKSTT